LGPSRAAAAAAAVFCCCSLFLRVERDPPRARLGKDGAPLALLTSCARRREDAHLQQQQQQVEDTSRSKKGQGVSRNVWLVHSREVMLFLQQHDTAATTHYCSAEGAFRYHICYIWLAVYCMLLLLLLLA
jgi:hypothetical protein